MKIRVEDSALGEVRVLVPDVFQDERGFFSEVYRADQFAELGLPSTFEQLNHSGSIRGVLRGLHFQWDPPMGKLMRVPRGRAYLVAVDIRKGSPTLGRWFGTEVSAENRKSVWAPAGFARGFCILSEFAEIQYLCSGIYNPDSEAGIRWNDPAVGIEWPVKDPILSRKDQEAPVLSEWLSRPDSERFGYP